MVRLTVLAISVLLVGCAPLIQQKQALNPEEQWQARQEQLIQLTDWKISGRTAITQEKEGWNAGLNWVQQGGQFEIKLLGPFSQGGVTLMGNNHAVSLTMDDGTVLTAATPESLIAEALGIYLPVSALRSWVRGIPYSELTVEQLMFNEKGQLTHLEQQGWNIDYKRYIPFQRYTMPAKVFIRHESLSLRLIISDWDPAS
jgi:outer membrane lipoprotein LolB